MTDFSFTKENLEEAHQIIKKYPKGKQSSAVMPLLDLAQRQSDNYLTPVIISYIADMLDMAPIRVSEVASFYTMYNHKPVGKHHIQICTNISCWLRGSDKILHTCKSKLGIKEGELTEDGNFYFSQVECLGACSNAPMMQINDEYYEDLDENTTEKILNDLIDGIQPKSGSQLGRKSSEPFIDKKTEK